MLRLYNTETHEVEVYVGRGEGVVARIELLDMYQDAWLENQRRIQEAVEQSEDAETVRVVLIDVSMFLDVLNNQSRSN
jgi:hypothetical protein